MKGKSADEMLKEESQSVKAITGIENIFSPEEIEILRRATEEWLAPILSRASGKEKKSAEETAEARISIDDLAQLCGDLLYSKEQITVYAFELSDAENGVIWDEDYNDIIAQAERYHAVIDQTSIVLKYMNRVIDAAEEEMNRLRSEYGLRPYISSSYIAFRKKTYGDNDILHVVNNIGPAISDAIYTGKADKWGEKLMKALEELRDEIHDDEDKFTNGRRKANNKICSILNKGKGA